MFAEATCAAGRDGAGIDGETGRRTSCSAVWRGGVGFGCATAAVRIGGIFADAPLPEGTRGGADTAGGGGTAGALGNGAVAAGVAADATWALGRVVAIPLAGGDAWCETKTTVPSASSAMAATTGDIGQLRQVGCGGIDSDGQRSRAGAESATDDRDSTCG